ncbi:DUF1570 domain-containing protein [Vitiosangium sp. GDMCC 1.1324]|uniref:DUF1570 domain-containing protein n=1 Tax=Vitiosangium sp. (strain GDMCC 1.1324) TaxID=2138576 RepID=UPI00130E0805|nr:DUF1570 domain-containing protein [Vitiosangium sp. GDMCC 1.1324]
MRSHLELEESKRLVRELEAQRRILRRYWNDTVDPPGETEVLLVRASSTLDEFSGGRAEPHFTQFTERGPQLVLSGASAVPYFMKKEEFEDPLPILRHELAHLLSHYILLRQPRWLAEGLAEYLEMADVQEASGEVLFGMAYKDTLVYLRDAGGRVPDLESLWAWDEQSLHRREARLYRASAWAWVHYLLNEHPERFADFQARLARAEDPRRAWEAAFQGVEDLRNPFQNYLRRPQLSTRAVALPPLSTEEPTVRDMGCAEVFALRGQLHLEIPGQSPVGERVAAAAREVDRALHEDPANAEALVLKARLVPEPAQRLDLALKLAWAHPESGQAWALLGRALAETGASEEDQRHAFQRAEQLAPDEAEVLGTLARFYARAGPLEKALEAAQHAVRLSPGNPVVLDTCASVLDQLGRCPDSEVMQARALDLLGQGAPRELRAEYERRLTLYQERCRAGAARGAGGGRLPAEP